jgi:hypothetical protein
MSESENLFPCRFAFTYSEQEIGAYGRLAAARADPGPDGSSFFFAMIALIIGLGLIVALARYNDIIDQSALEPVLFSAYASFILGVAAYWLAMYLGYRRALRRYRAYSAGAHCELAFEADSITSRDDRYDVRAPWQSVHEVDETASLIVLWLGYRTAFVLPKRLLADRDGRAFVAALRARVAAAQSNRPAQEGGARA